MKFRLTLLMTGLVLANAANAATEVNLRSQPASYMQKQLAAPSGSKVKIQTTRTDIDFNQTAHTRIQQTYDGIQVWDATGVIHTPNAGKSVKNSFAAVQANTTMNGVIYEGLEKDLARTPALALTKSQQQKALSIAKDAFAKKSRLNTSSFKDEKSQLIIFVDDNKQAHYAYLTHFDYYTANSATRPTSIIDATTQKIYRTWEGLLFAKSKDEAVAEARAKFARDLQDDSQPRPGDIYDVVIGGVGGNVKAGEIIYDGKQAKGSNGVARDLEWELAPGVFYKFTLCGLWNNDITVLDVSFDNNQIASTCAPNLQQRGNVHWMSIDKGLTRWNVDEMNDGYSPSLDAFYAAQAIKNMYQEWYNVPALIDEEGKPMQYTMRVHFGRKFDNAFWDGKQMTFGDGGTMFYPMSSMGVAAHEISHGFTDTYSHISGEYPQMGALHESFSDMAAVATENYTTGKNGWDIGREVMKNEGALRYLDNPTKDGQSIDHMKDFDETEAHAAAGITNKAFYLMATSKGWNTHKAFDVWVKANMHYWNSSMKTLGEAACGVVAATKDYGYDLTDVRIAFAKVGIDTDRCGETK